MVEKKLLFGTFLGFLALALIALPAVQAHIEPEGCTATGGGMSFGALRSDGLTDIPDEGLVADNEIIKYRVTLSGAGPSVCAFEGGTLTITTPDHVVHDVTPPGGFPIIGGSGGDSIVSAFVDYTVAHADEVVQEGQPITISPL